LVQSAHFRFFARFTHKKIENERGGIWDLKDTGMIYFFVKKLITLFVFNFNFNFNFIFILIFRRTDTAL